jgi:hypothetical protein
MPAQSQIGSFAPRTTPAQCRLYLAFDRVEPCAGERCVFFRFPGVDGCAVDAWRPGVEADQPSAAWFLSRMLDAEEARSRRSARFGLDRGSPMPGPEPQQGSEAMRPGAESPAP